MNDLTSSYENYDPKTGEIVPPGRRQSLPTVFQPAGASDRVAKADAILDYAKAVKDWALAEEAVARKVDEIRQVTGWWKANVTVRLRPPGGISVNADLRSQISLRDAEELTGFSQQQISRWRNALRDPDKYRAALLGAVYRKAMAEETEHNHRAQGTGENEWYTPAEYLRAAHDVMGGFDLDPASSAAAQKTVRAKNFFTKADDGLAREWRGRIWLNPPYEQPLIADFVSKMCEERTEGRVTAGVMLTHNYTDTAWFHEAARVADAICFTRGRIKFHNAEGETCSPTQGQAFFYFGEDIEAFADRFRSIGFVVGRLFPPIPDAA